MCKALRNGCILLNISWEGSREETVLHFTPRISLTHTMPCASVLLNHPVSGIYILVISSSGLKTTVSLYNLVIRHSTINHLNIISPCMWGRRYSCSYSVSMFSEVKNENKHIPTQRHKIWPTVYTKLILWASANCNP